MKWSEKPMVHRCWLLILVVVWGIDTSSAGELMAEQQKVSGSVEQSIGLRGKWCFVKKGKVHQYTVKEGELRIQGGRSGRIIEVSLSCDEAYTRCETRTIRGYGTPVDEILELDGEKMNLTRKWGGGWKGKTYSFTYSRCPKW